MFLRLKFCQESFFLQNKIRNTSYLWNAHFTLLFTCQLSVLCLGVTVLVERVGEEDEMSLAKSSTKVQNDLALNLSNILVLKVLLVLILFLHLLFSISFAEFILNQVSGREEEPTVRLFTDFVDIIDSIAADWKIEWESSVEAKHGYPPHKLFFLFDLVLFFIVVLF